MNTEAEHIKSGIGYAIRDVETAQREVYSIIRSLEDVQLTLNYVQSSSLAEVDSRTQSYIDRLKDNLADGNFILEELKRYRDAI